MRRAVACVAWEVALGVLWLAGRLDDLEETMRDARTRAAWALTERHDARPLARLAELERRWRWWGGGR